MKKRAKGILFAWMVIAAVAAGTAFFIARRIEPGMGAAAAPGAQPNADVAQDVSDDSDANSPVSVPMQQFSNDGYALSIPASWSVERTATDTIAVHPDAASPDAVCKIEVSAFPFVAGVDVPDWIAHRIGADPSVAVVERSSEEVALASGTAIEWSGTMDGIPTTLAYAFNAAHAYEIVPSVIGESAAGDVQCGGILQTFLSGLSL
ncbi:MAG TPA: hypothetical protein VMA75_01425 [Candidatus Paceibacterota bacterium]|nr:hypothetical protein [Candidatus Paceibacterota bacterium]